MKHFSVVVLAILFGFPALAQTTPAMSSDQQSAVAQATAEKLHEAITLRANVILLEKALHASQGKEAELFKQIDALKADLKRRSCAAESEKPEKEWEGHIGVAPKEPEKK